MENFIRSKYGNDVYFITAMAGIFSFEDKKYTDAVLSIIHQENIAEFYFVSDNSCRFINNALKNDLGNKSENESFITCLLTENRSSFQNGISEEAQRTKLAELIVKSQAEQFKKSNIFQNLNSQKEFFVSELVTSKKTNQIIKNKIDTIKSYGLPNLNFKSY